MLCRSLIQAQIDIYMVVESFNFVSRAGASQSGRNPISNQYQIFFENLILVQDERWRCALSMQVERSARTAADG
jgi:hypothetical protein